ncbi:IS3 family transposase [Candidatus Villigracilis vicinus]|uniref:IS3 family transposase n=1 Tax=Candidatus Villigracilis vicinus TaxID=3140679 RepID=UPI0031EA9BDB
MHGRGNWEKQTRIRDAWRKIQAVHEASHKSYGYRRITIHLQRKLGLQINHKAVLRLMGKLGIRSQARKPKMYKKLEEIGTYHRYPNVLNRDFVATKPNQKWVTDVTYIRTVQGWAYLSTIKDLYDGFIVAHVFDQTNSIALVTQTLKRAQQKEKVTDGLVLHSDQGTQYTSQAYHVLVGEYNITPSMSRRGNCWDNAPMENFLDTSKRNICDNSSKPPLKIQSNLLMNTFTFTTMNGYN